MTPPESIELCNLIGKLWGAKINDAQLLALQPRLKDLPIDLAAGKLAVNEEFLNPSTDKVPVLARIWRRLQGIARPRRDNGAAPVAMTAERLCGEILGLLARSHERLGEGYAREQAQRFWTLWRNQLIDMGVSYADATAWLVENTPTEQAWVDDLERRLVAGRAKQVERFRRMAEAFAPALPVARKQAGFYTRGEPQIGAAR